MIPVAYRNTCILAALRILNPLLSMVLISLISRMRGLEFLGLYSVVMTVTAMFSTVGDMGMQPLLVREVAKDSSRAASCFTSAVVLGLSSSALLALLMYLSVPYFGYSGEATVCLKIMSLYLPLAVLVGLFEGAFMAFERMEFIFYEQICLNILRLAGSCVVLYLGYGMRHFVMVIVISTLLTDILCFFLFHRRLARFQFRVDLELTKYLLSKCPVFLMLTLVGVLSLRIDVIVLSKLSTLEQVALYTAAYKLFEAVMIVPSVYMKSCYPELSRLGQGGLQDPRALRMVRGILKHTLWYVGVAAVFFIVFAKLPLQLIYGSKFLGAAATFQLLVLGVIPWGVARMYGHVLLATDLQRYDLAATVIATLCNAALNLMLVPVYGAIGAAIANTTGFVLFFMLESAFIGRAVKGIGVAAIATAPALVSLLLAALLYGSRRFPVLAALELAALGCLVAYCGCNKEFRRRVYRGAADFVRNEGN